MKYKNKYLSLKNQVGGALEGCVSEIRASLPEPSYENTGDNMTFGPESSKPEDSIYDQFMKTLNQIESDETSDKKALVLNIGSSSIIDAAGLHYFKPDKSILESIIKQNDQLYIIAIDPARPNKLIPFEIASKLYSSSNVFEFKGYFPLTPGKEKANLVLNKLINLKVNDLVIINEVSSGCWNSFRVIMHNRPGTHYFVHVNDAKSALNCGIQVYGHKGTYNRCKRENPDYFHNDWINFKTLTTDGDDVEPLDNIEKIAALPKEETINIFIKLTDGKIYNQIVSKDITLQEIKDIILKFNNVRLILINGKAHDPNDEPLRKLNEITQAKNVSIQVIPPRV